MLKGFLYILLMLFGHFLMAQQSLQENVNKLLANSFYKYANIGISVRDIQTGELVVDVEKDKMLVPASSLKLITTLSGVELLGKDFRFETKISYDGYVDTQGTLKGNIYIEGGGDPTFGSARIPGSLSTTEIIDRMAEDINTYGIHCIEGNIIADESVFNSFPISPSWQWNDLGNYYAAGAWGLNINENQYAIYFHRNGAVGSMSKIAYFDPNIPDLEMINEVTIDNADTGDNSYIFGGPYHYGKRIVGTIPQGKELYRVKGSIPDPPLYVANRLFSALQKREMGGHHFKTKYQTDDSKSSRILISKYYSPVLSTIVRYTNDHSINLFSESILKILGLKFKNIGSGTAGVAAIKEFLEKKGLDVLPLHMEDGSGLSARNLMSPDFLTSFLLLYGKDKSMSVLENLLPPAGKRGTVKNILLQSKAKGNMLVKSGSMDKILTYSGYCKTVSGRMVSFSVFLNSSTAKKMKENKTELEKILDAIYRFY
ncbi:MAG: D-alanyl-D-alanine carboxypeptidase/D-alanyl-D-alanine-endopeptidase [Saprospiraceae bacterium]|nr:D-alanyl-D-alanine carboxypeptidase/D-alanyl-D-alanine-endopeptidase [Saprospiraceae bacterium]